MVQLLSPLQGLDWYKARLKTDRDGDLADEFLLEPNVGSSQPADKPLKVIEQCLMRSLALRLRRLEFPYQPCCDIKLPLLIAVTSYYTFPPCQIFNVLALLKFGLSAYQRLLC